MHLEDIPFQVTDWSAVAVTEHPGDTDGTAPHRSRTRRGAKLFIVD
jgi:hypothetical protein